MPAASLPRALGLLCLCTLLLSQPGRAQLMFYGNSMLECAQKAGLTHTVQAMQSTTSVFKDPSLVMTFFAMDDANWVTLGKMQRPPQSVQQMLANKDFVAQILKNHILKGMVPTNNWPSALGLQYAKTYQSLGIAVPQLWVDARYTYQVTGWTGNNQVGCSLSNLQCGNGIMHVVTDSWQDAVNAGK